MTICFCNELLMVNPPAAAGGADGSPHRQHSCSECGRIFITARGLGVHRRRAHAKVFYAEAESQANTRRPGNCSEEEKNILARAEAQLIVAGAFRPTMANRLLEGSVENMSSQAIKSQRRMASHRRRVLDFVSEVRFEQGEQVGGEINPDPIFEQGRHFRFCLRGAKKFNSNTN